MPEKEAKDLREVACKVCKNVEADCVCCPECGHVCPLDIGEDFCPVCGEGPGAETTPD